MKKNQPKKAEFSGSIRMIHPKTQDIRQVQCGYNWYAAIFGPFFFLFKGMFQIALYCLIFPILAQLFFAERANKLYMLKLVQQGYKAMRGKPGSVSFAEWKWGFLIPRYQGSSKSNSDEAVSTID